MSDYLTTQSSNVIISHLNSVVTSCSAHDAPWVTGTAVSAVVWSAASCSMDSDDENIEEAVEGEQHHLPSIYRDGNHDMKLMCDVCLLIRVLLMAVLRKSP